MSVTCWKVWFEAKGFTYRLQRHNRLYWHLEIQEWGWYCCSNKWSGTYIRQSKRADSTSAVMRRNGSRSTTIAIKRMSPPSLEIHSHLLLLVQQNLALRWTNRYRG